MHIRERVNDAFSDHEVRQQLQAYGQKGTTMAEISTQIGIRIRNFRKKRGMTLDALSDQIHKSKSTVSKYEKGEISVDIETLYEIADALDVHVEQLLYCPPRFSPGSGRSSNPAFFQGASQFYSYLLTVAPTRSSAVSSTCCPRQRITAIRS